jgi:hypothetical protein
MKGGPSEPPWRRRLQVRESGRSEEGACSEAKFVGPTRNGRSPKDEAKPYCISPDMEIAVAESACNTVYL